MPTSSVFYINGPSLASSTAIFSDEAMTICATNGFYSDGLITREQVDCILLPAQGCPNCDIYEYPSSLTARTSSALACADDIDHIYYLIPLDGVPTSLEVGDAVFQDVLSESPLFDGWYVTGPDTLGCSISYRVAAGIVVEIINCCAVSASLCYSTLSALDATCGCLA
jgi:hypothetical protein